MRIAILVLLATTTARADTLVAGAAKRTLFVDKITSAGIEPVYDEPRGFRDVPGAFSWAFSDQATLWIVRTNKTPGAVSVVKLVDGKPAPVRDVTLADWKLKREPIPKDEADPTPRVLVAKDGGVYLEKCLTANGERGCKLGYLRVDKDAPLATKRPAVTAEPALPAIAAPAGYTAAVEKLKLKKTTFAGYSCKGPHGSTEWPGAPGAIDDGALAELVDKGQVARVEWVVASPPILRIAITSSRGGDTRYLVDCKTDAAAPHPLGDGRWLDGNTLRKPDGSEAGTLRSHDDLAIAR